MYRKICVYICMPIYQFILSIRISQSVYTYASMHTNTYTNSLFLSNTHLYTHTHRDGHTHLHFRIHSSLRKPIKFELTEKE